MISLVSGIVKRIISFGRKIIPRPIRNNYCIFPDPPKTPAEYDPTVATLPDIAAKMGRLTSEEAIKEALEYCRNLYEEEEKRQDLVINKATILAGFSGTTIAAILALFAVYIDSDLLSRLSENCRLLSLGCAVSVFICLVLSILFSLHAIKIGVYDRPNPKRVFEYGEKSVQDVRRRIAKEYFYSYVQNHFRNSLKLDSFAWGLNYFRLSIIFSLGMFLILLCATHVGNGSSNLLSTTITTTPVPTLTITETSTPTPPSAVPPTLSSTAAIVPSSTKSTTPVPQPSPTN